MAVLQRLLMGGLATLAVVPGGAAIIPLVAEEVAVALMATEKRWPGIRWLAVMAVLPLRCFLRGSPYGLAVAEAVAHARVTRSVKAARMLAMVRMSLVHRADTVLPIAVAAVVAVLPMDHQCRIPLAATAAAV